MINSYYDWPFDAYTYDKYIFIINDTRKKHRIKKNIFKRWLIKEGQAVSNAGVEEIRPVWSAGKTIRMGILAQSNRQINFNHTFKSVRSFMRTD